MAKTSGADVLEKLNQQRTPNKSIKEDIEKRADSIRAVLPPAYQGSIERFLHLTMLAIMQNPAIANCSRGSIIGGVMQAAQLGLSFGILGHCYLIPRRDRNGIYHANFQLGYQGMIELARRDKDVVGLAARPVYENEHFSIEHGTESRVKHVPLTSGDPGKMIGVYCYGVFNGFEEFEFYRMDELERIRNKYVESSSFAWKDEEVAMYRKTAMRQFLKWKPLAPDIKAQIAVDDTVHTFESDQLVAKPVDDFEGVSVPEDKPAEQPKRTRKAKPPVSETETEGEDEEASEEDIPPLTPEQEKKLDELF